MSRCLTVKDIEGGKNPETTGKRQFIFINKYRLMVCNNEWSNASVFHFLFIKLGFVTLTSLKCVAFSDTKIYAQMSDPKSEQKKPHESAI